MKRYSTAFLLALFAAATARAQDFERIAPKLPDRPGAAPSSEAPPPKSATPVLPPLPRDVARPEAPTLRSVVFVPKQTVVKRAGVEAAPGTQVRGVPFLEDPRFQARMQRYYGQPLTLALASIIAQDVTAYYAERDRPVVNVNVPEQDVTSGVMQMVVIEGTVAEVRVEGNRWFRAERFRAGVRLREGAPIRKSHLDADLALLNSNPFRTVNSVFTPGEKPGTTDVILKVEDRFPLRVYGGYENTGTDSTDENRVFAGFNWGNVLGLDHQFNYQFTASPDFDLFRAHSGSYFIPLPWRHSITIFGAYAETAPELPQDFSQEGRSYQVSFRYNVPLPPIGSYKHELTAGYDYKNTNNNLAFGGTEVFDSSVDVSQFLLSYNSGFEYKFGRVSFEASLFVSPGGMTDDNDEAAFAATREGADPDYVYGLFRLNHLARLPADFTLSNQFTGQVASGPLVGTEQLGFGGYNSIRGFSERIVNGDGGFIMNHEIRTPEFHPLRALGALGASNPGTSTKTSSTGKDTVPAANGAGLQDSLQFLAFWDFGVATIQDAAPGVDDSVTLSSLGLGLRYAVNPYVSVRADYGWQLTDLEGEDDSGRFHVGVTVSY